MARVIDSDYIDPLSLIDGFDIGINFDGFEENVKKLMELPIRYIDSAHDKAVELIEDVHAMFRAPNLHDEVPNKPHETFKDPSSSNAITGCSSASVEPELVGPNAEVSTPPASLITVESSSTDSIDTDAHATESSLTKSPENTSSEEDHIGANDPCLLPKGTSTTEIYDSFTSEEVILWNPETSVKPPRSPEPTTISQDDYVPHALDKDEVTEPVGLDCYVHSDILVDSSVFYGAIPLENSSANCEEQSVLYSVNDPVEATTHGTSISHDLSVDVPRCADNSNMWPDDMIKYVDIDLRDDQKHMKSDKFEAASVHQRKNTDLRDDQEHMKNDNFEASSVHQRKNTSFKKMFMRGLSSKLRWSKKQASAHQAMPATSQDAENLGYQAVSSSDDLEDDWEVVL